MSRDLPIGDDAHAARAREHRFPWCDTCKRPAVWSEHQGRALHTTAEHPFGTTARGDDHEVTMHDWWSADPWEDA
jgi:hypothetical protein